MKSRIKVLEENEERHWLIINQLSKKRLNRKKKSEWVADLAIEMYLPEHRWKPKKLALDHSLKADTRQKRREMEIDETYQSQTEGDILGSEKWSNRIKARHKPKWVYETPKEKKDHFTYRSSCWYEWIGLPTSEHTKRNIWTSAARTGSCRAKNKKSKLI